ncbi:IS200/IS605 family transposase [uncultured Sunxiuqinia sp.]|uniref:IS200/IS605 family transposase n=1 Tax=uncultured Sunxiuqinia sp. TaxID=1573825 RepID=UPI00262B7738|nr:IS200/IS605 family transposase [uncultured Sunxiuqinia sp.]
MPQSLSKVYLHITFSTKQRAKLIDKDIQTKLFEYLGGICKGLACNPVRVGGTNDHVHILCTLSRKISQAELIEALKKNSSKWMKTQGQRYENFYWQNGYGAFSVNPTEVDVVTNYINFQEEHHRTKTFQEEFQAFLKKYQVEYDERYVWD